MKMFENVHRQAVPEKTLELPAGTQVEFENWDSESSCFNVPTWSQARISVKLSAGEGYLDPGFLFKLCFLAGIFHICKHTDGDAAAVACNCNRFCRVDDDSFVLFFFFFHER